MSLSLRENICRVRRLPKDPQLLIGRAELLIPEDRELVEAIFLRSQTAASLARIMGSTPRKVSNRVRQLARRMSSRDFLNAARSLPYISKEDAKLARLRFCAGLSERKLARKTGQSLHVLRRKLVSIRAQITTLNQIRRASRKRGLIPGEIPLSQWRIET